MSNVNLKKLILPNLPYLLFVYLFAIKVNTVNKEKAVPGFMIFRHR